MSPSDLSPSVSRRRVTIQIDTVALAQNFTVARQCAPNAKVFCVLKADAYGHGAVACALALSAAGADGFAVVFPAEAETLRDAGVREPILVLQGPSSLAEVRLLAAQDLCAVIHDESQLALIEKSTVDNLKVWLKVDTGMGRMGLSTAELPRIKTALRRNSQIRCLGILSHFANADEDGNAYTQSQIKRFNSLDFCSVSGSAQPTLLRSLANSAAVLTWPQSHFEWVRPGIMLYGVNPMLRPLCSHPALTPVMQVNAPLIALKMHKRGDGIGYGQCYHCPQDMPVGYTAIGYGDGLPRRASGASVVIRGVHVPVIGRVSMDSIALDLRGVDARVGDNVVIWGKHNPVESLAAVAGTIGYELLCGIRGARSYVSVRQP